MKNKIYVVNKDTIAIKLSRNKITLIDTEDIDGKINGFYIKFNT